MAKPKKTSAPKTSKRPTSGHERARTHRAPPETNTVPQATWPASSPIPQRRHPLMFVEWADPATLRANDYNPNRVFTPEMELLKLSILEDGWTQPVVAHHDGTIVDGFHRWTLASTDPDIIAISGGLVPVVRLAPKSVGDAKASTVRHNRARGQHGILAMGEIVRSMRDQGMTDEEICLKLGMEDEELERLADERATPDRLGKESYGKGWVPTREA